MKWSEFVKDYLTFTRKERIGILIIVGLILFTLFLPGILRETSNNNPTPIDTAWIAVVKKLEIKNKDSLNDHFQQKKVEEDAYTYQYDRKKSNSHAPNISKGELFYFDPNTISTSDWKRLGLRDKTIQTILNFLSKGGHFYKPEDLQKIYGFHKDEFERLEPYVSIKVNPSSLSQQVVSSKPSDETQPAKTYASRYSSIDINTADTSAFISLPGIGSKLAVRIVAFRDKLGGFYSIDQIGEIYGLRDSTFQKIKQYLKLENPSVKKINVNTATIDELKAHPYIKYSIANPIVAYRNEHGSFSSLEEIKKVMTITDEIYQKIVPYLSL